ncbi:hypothetical protein, partial [Campylobacter insulaenigrae]
FFVMVLIGITFFIFISLILVGLIVSIKANKNTSMKNKIIICFVVLVNIVPIVSYIIYISNIKLSDFRFFFSSICFIIVFGLTSISSLLFLNAKKIISLSLSPLKREKNYDNDDFTDISYSSLSYNIHHDD